MKIFLAPSSSVYGNFIDLSSKSHGNEMKILNLTQILNFQVDRACPDQRGSDMRGHALLESCIAQFCLVSSWQCTNCKAMLVPNPCGSILRCRTEQPVQGDRALATDVLEVPNFRSLRHSGCTCHMTPFAIALSSVKSQFPFLLYFKDETKSSQDLFSVWKSYTGIKHK